MRQQGIIKVKRFHPLGSINTNFYGDAFNSGDISVWTTWPTNIAVPIATQQVSLIINYTEVCMNYFPVQMESYKKKKGYCLLTDLLHTDLLRFHRLFKSRHLSEHATRPAERSSSLSQTFFWMPSSRTRCRFTSSKREAKVAWAISLSLWNTNTSTENFILLIYNSTLKPTRMSMCNCYRVWEGERQEGQINITSLLPTYRGPSEFRRKQCYHVSGWLPRLSLLKQFPQWILNANAYCRYDLDLDLQILVKTKVLMYLRFKI